MKIVKNIILTSVVLTTLASCDMDKYPYDSIPVDNAIQSVSDCENCVQVCIAIYVLYLNQQIL